MDVGDRIMPNIAPQKPVEKESEDPGLTELKGLTAEDWKKGERLRCRISGRRVSLFMRLRWQI